MAASPTSGVAICSVCGEPLNAKGDCVACLLRGGLDEAVAEAKPLASLAFGDFEVEQRADGFYWELGHGAMGVTYLAMDKVLRRRVALKVIDIPEVPTGRDSQAVRDRFLREARAAAGLRHPNVAAVFQFGASLDATHCYYAMELVEGTTLAACVERDGPLTVKEALEMAIQIARALMAAEAHGLIHRDLKPANIMLTSSSTATTGVEVKIIDFGLAKAIADAGGDMDLTYGGFVGATLWFALTGVVPRSGNTIGEIRDLHRRGDLPVEQLAARKVPAPVIKLLRSMLAVDPSKRPASARELMEALESCRQKLPHGISSFYKVAALILIAAIIGGGFFVLRVDRERVASSAKNIAPPASTLAVSAKSIAVLPFESRSEDKANAYFADGIQDEILTRLSKIADLKVISRTSTQPYKSAPKNLPEIARQLGVAHILEGSVQKSGDAVRVNIRLIKATNDSELWADTFDRKLTDIFAVETEVAKAIADQLLAKLTGLEEEVIAAKPTDNPGAYDAYLRGLAYISKTANTANSLAAQKYFGEALRLDPKFAVSWALLSITDAHAYLVQYFQPTVALREEARQAAETALTLQPNLGEAVLAKGYYHYSCLKDYDTAVRYFEQARQLLPNSSQIPESLAYIARRRGQWDRSESYFNDAERLDPRNVRLLTQHAFLYKDLRRFPEALRKLDQVLNIMPDDLDSLAGKAAIAQAEGDLGRASALLTPLHPAANHRKALEAEVYQAILERRAAPAISRLKEILAKPDPALGYINGRLRFWLGWAQEVAGNHAAAQETWRQARSELEPFLKEQPENFQLIEDLALTYMGLGDKAAALALAEQAMAVNPIEKDAVDGPDSIEILARVSACMGEPDRAIAALQKLLSIPSSGPLAGGPGGTPLTPALLRLDPMFDSLRNDPRFQKLCEEKKP
ncbi:MAG: hypothetical protein DME33_05330 [Verrucomicrobia bacterium]|nr:MAG: hypothetical protein DME33_05330 [Verrucomicrobiota bacterium]